ncbi:MAPEG family protein [Phenylobacterium sp. LjRoot219]|uniref:MAPEG family protein n=1 Tax=Phenylobacterium sp. LjRoot219 TaxID=3342283 RepID=UPI003ECE781D
MPEPLAAYWILLVGALMPYPLVIMAKVGPTYDNADPRNPAALTTARRRNAFGAHANCLEALPLFAAAVLLAGFRHAPAPTVDLLAFVWLLCRLSYVACYLSGRASLRSMIWLGATAAAIAIFVLAVVQGTGA